MKVSVHQPIELALGSTFSKSTFLVTGNGTKMHLPVFQKADNCFYVRFSSPVPGRFTCTIAEKTVAIHVVLYTGTNPLLAHGAVAVAPEGSYLAHHDGTPFFYLADTWWFGGTRRLHFPKRFLTLLADRKNKGFTAIQIVVGIPPEVEAFSPDAANEGGLPFQADWSINPAYFDAIDKRVEALMTAGVVPVIFGGWGHHVDWMGTARVKALWREIIARYASYPVIFSLSGEADAFLSPKGLDPVQAETHRERLRKTLRYLPKPVLRVLKAAKHAIVQTLYQHSEQKLLENRIKKWHHIGSYVASLDPYKRIMTVHPQRQIPAFELFGSPPWLTLNAVQTGHSLSSYPFLLKAITGAKKPIVNLECWYEGILDNFDAYYQRVAFWSSILSGAKGHAYGAHGIWQMANQDNFMQHWGASQWKKALLYKGAAQVGLSSRFLQKHIDWQTMTRSDSLISYRVRKNLRFPPLSAVTKKHCIVYIPDQEGIDALHIQKNLTSEVMVYDPRTLSKIRDFAESNSLSLPLSKATKDILLVFAIQ